MKELLHEAEARTYYELKSRNTSANVINIKSLFQNNAVLNSGMVEFKLPNYSKYVVQYVPKDTIKIARHGPKPIFKPCNKFSILESDNGSKVRFNKNDLIMSVPAFNNAD